MVSKDCTLSKVNSAILKDIKSDIGEMKGDMNKRLEKIDNNISQLFNHQSSRLPPWTVAIITLLSSIATGFIVRAFI